MLPRITSPGTSHPAVLFSLCEAVQNVQTFLPSPNASPKPVEGSQQEPSQTETASSFQLVFKCSHFKSSLFSFSGSLVVSDAFLYPLNALD